MSIISAEVAPKLIKANKLEVSCTYNNEGPCEAKNENALAPFEGETGLPPLTEPISVNNLMVAASNQLIADGQGIIIPAGACFTLDLAFLSEMGYAVAITLPAAGDVICENALFWRTPALDVADYQKGSVSTWDDGSALNSDDPRFGEAKTDYAANTFQIKIEATPLTAVSLASTGGGVQCTGHEGSDSLSMIIEVLVMDADNYQSSTISFASHAALGD